MIVTLTPNPSVDRTVFVDQLALGSVNRSHRSWSEPSGKGVNVALALHAHGVPARAIVTAGGPVGAQFRQMLSTSGLDTVIVPIDGDIRSNISLTQPDGTVTKVNEPGPPLSGAERDRLISAVASNLGGATWLVCAGSLPTGVPDELVRRAGRTGPPPRRAGRRRHIWRADSSQSLHAHPDLVKPNLHELAELTGDRADDSRRGHRSRSRGPPPRCTHSAGQPRR